MNIKNKFFKIEEEELPSIINSIVDKNSDYKEIYDRVVWNGDKNQLKEKDSNHWSSMLPVKETGNKGEVFFMNNMIKGLGGWFISEVVPKSIKNPDYVIFDLDKLYIPLCFYLGIKFDNDSICDEQLYHHPILSDMSPDDIIKLSILNIRKDRIRELVENVVAHHPQLSNSLFILDYKYGSKLYKYPSFPTIKENLLDKDNYLIKDSWSGEVEKFNKSSWDKKLSSYHNVGIHENFLNKFYTKFTKEYKKLWVVPLSNIFSYSKPEFLELDKKIGQFKNNKFKKCVILPCTTTKPYHKGTEKEGIINKYILDNEFHSLILTSLGLIPEEFWGEEMVIRYDTGTRDMWKLMKLIENYFTNNKYDQYDIVVGYGPYQEMIDIISKTKPHIIDPTKINWIKKPNSPNQNGIKFYPKY